MFENDTFQQGNRDKIPARCMFLDVFCGGKRMIWITRCNELNKKMDKIQIKNIRRWVGSVSPNLESKPPPLTWQVEATNHTNIFCHVQMLIIFLIIPSMTKMKKLSFLALTKSSFVVCMLDFCQASKVKICSFSSNFHL